jgi:amino acid adenylation domain-containing protein/thioester reductase-like protein
MSRTLDLTSHQSAIWLEDKLNAGKPIFNIGTYLELSSIPNATLLEAAIQNVILENDALRLKVHEKKGRCEQEFEDHKNFSLGIKDFKNGSIDRLVVLDWMQAEFEIPINIDDEILYSITLITYDETKSYLFFKFHHIFIDGWSRALFINNIANHYNALIGRPYFSNYSSFSDYVENWINHNTSKSKSKSLKFWKDKFTAVERSFLFWKKDVSLIFSPSDRKRLCFDRTKYGMIGNPIGTDAKIKFYALIASLYTTLSRSTGKRDIVFGIPLLNRKGEEEKNTIGYFLGVIPIRLSFNSNDSFKQMVEGVRTEMQSSYNYRNVSIQEINSELGVNFNNSLQLFDVICSFENHNYDCFFGEAEVEESGTFSTQCNQNPLAIHVQDSNSNECINFEFDYNLNYFNEIEIDTLIKRYERTIDFFIEKPNALLKDAPILSKNEIAQLEKNGIGKQRNLEQRNIVELITDTCNSYPDKIILRDENDSLTCKELLHESQRLASYLIDTDTKHGDSIGIISPRSVNSFVSILGILMSGARFVPFADELPVKRKNYMISKANVKRIVYSGNPNLKGLSKYDRVQLDNVPDKFEYCAPALTYDSPVYIMFTSGTTGQPKGVQIVNDGLLNLIESMWTEIFSHYNNNVRLALLSSFNFDAFIVQGFASLAFGLELNIIPEKVRKNGKLLGEFLVENKIDICDGIPTLFKGLLKSYPVPPKGLRLIHFLAGGEAFKPELAEQLFLWNNNEDFKITNIYGPTECTVNSSYYTFDKQSFDPNEDVPIGHPIQNSKIWIFDNHGELLPPGVIGEICIGGAGLSKGYVNGEELTEDAFEIHPLVNERVYHSGDLGRWNSNGDLIFHGRKDHQVKVRGYRIELSAIEHCLVKIPNVSSATVIKVNRLYQDFLVAFLETEQHFEQNKIKELLSQTLPDYMIPHFIHSLLEIPLTNTGKIDRVKLESYAFDSKNVVGHTAETKTEARLSIIMSDVLEIENVDVEESFFSQGGDSLGLVFLLAKIEEEFKVSLNMSQFGSMNTIRRIGAFIDSNDETNRITLDLKKQLGDLRVLGDVSFSGKTPRSTSAFITGGTGFVGAHIVYESCKKFDTVICLVRDKNVKEATSRLKQTFNRYNLNNVDWTKIEVVIGDLSKVQLGIELDLWNRLCANVNTIFHCGAMVNFVMDFEAMKSTNIGSTLELLKLCQNGIKKQFNYISTKGVFSTPSKIYYENDSIENEIHFADKGYSSTKWVAESLTQSARYFGIECNIFRLGRITDSTESGLANFDDFFHRFIIGCIMLRSFPKELLGKTTDLTPVDLSAKAIVKMADKANGSNFHMINQVKTTYQELIDCLNQEGIDLKIMDYNEWIKSVSLLNAKNESNPLFLITSILKQNQWFLNENISLLNNETLVRMKAVGVEWPKIENLRKIYIRNWKKRVGDNYIIKSK